MGRIFDIFVNEQLLEGKLEADRPVWRLSQMIVPDVSLCNLDQLRNCPCHVEMILSEKEETVEKAAEEARPEGLEQSPLFAFPFGLLVLAWERGKGFKPERSGWSGCRVRSPRSSLASSSPSCASRCRVILELALVCENICELRSTPWRDDGQDEQQTGRTLCLSIHDDTCEEHLIFDFG